MIILNCVASLSELDDLVRSAKENGYKDLTLLKCTSSYPVTPEGTNLFTIPHMKELFKCNVGLSDHTIGIGVAVTSVSLGAMVIEKNILLCPEQMAGWTQHFPWNQQKWPSL